MLHFSDRMRERGPAHVGPRFVVRFCPAQCLSSMRELTPEQLARLVEIDLQGGAYITGDGVRLVRVHRPYDDCYELGCVIHNPTDPHQDWPTRWVPLYALMVRTCPHGVEHPDTNALAYVHRKYTEWFAKEIARAYRPCTECR